MPGEETHVKQRLHAAVHYLVPSWVRAWRRRQGGAFSEHHACQAAGLGTLLLALVLAYVAAFLAVSAAMVYWRSGYHTLEVAVEWGFSALFVLWLLLVLAGSGLALLGSTRPLPVVLALGRRSGLRRLTVAASIAGCSVLAGVALVAAESTTLARDHGPAKVTVLYDDLGIVPRWVMTLASYRLATAAIDRWGEGSVVVAPISTTALEEALARSTLVYLATHGTGLGGGVAYGTQQFLPDDVGKAIKAGPDLRFVYLTACDGGAGAAGRAWEQAFAPARVVSFDRLSVNLEHAWWLWVQSPRVIASLP